MTTRGASDEPRIVPYLAYADAPAAIEFLCRAFGFEERFRLPMPDGRIGHAEIARDGQVIMLASASQEMGFVSPKGLPGVHAQIHYRVDDVDGHYDRAKSSGATIASAPQEQHGQRMYRAIDPEGHRWIFFKPSDAVSGDSDQEKRVASSAECSGTQSEKVEAQ